MTLKQGESSLQNEEDLPALQNNVIPLKLKQAIFFNTFILSNFSGFQSCYTETNFFFSLNDVAQTKNLKLIY